MCTCINKTGWENIITLIVYSWEIEVLAILT